MIIQYTSSIHINGSACLSTFNIVHFSLSSFNQTRTMQAKTSDSKRSNKTKYPPPSRQKKKSQMPNRKLINTLSSQGEEYTDSGGMNIYKGQKYEQNSQIFISRIGEKNVGRRTNNILHNACVSKPVMLGKIGNCIINIEMREPHRPEAEINSTIHMSSKLGEIVLFPTISHVPAKLSMSCYGTKSCFFTSGNTSLI